MEAPTPILKPSRDDIKILRSYVAFRVSKGDRVEDTFQALQDCGWSPDVLRQLGNGAPSSTGSDLLSFLHNRMVLLFFLVCLAVVFYVIYYFFTQGL